MAEKVKFDMAKLDELIAEFKENDGKAQSGNGAAKTRARVGATAIGHQMDAYRKESKPNAK